MSKVRIADLAKARRYIAPNNFWYYFSQVSQNHIDFVLIDPQAFVTLCVIELDNKSHNKFDSIKRDKFVTKSWCKQESPCTHSRCAVIVTGKSFYRL